MFLQASEVIGHVYILGAVLASLLPAFAVQAQQTAFNARELGGQVVMAYQWRDLYGKIRQLVFRIPYDDMKRGEQEFTLFSNAAAAEYAYRAVKAKADGYTGPFTVRVDRQGQSFGVQASGNIDQAKMQLVMMDLEQAQNDANAAYMRKTYYTKVDDTHIMPDHKRLAKRYAPALAPLTAELKRQTPGLGVRERTDFLLNFLQSIPYDTLQSRYTSNGAGFQTPYGLFYGNKGDCDTKSVALAAALRGMYPSLRLTMVYVPNHAFIGVGVKQGPKDYALRMGGGVFVLADPTGPALTRLGEVSPDALRALKSGAFSYQEIPF